MAWLGKNPRARPHGPVLVLKVCLNYQKCTRPKGRGRFGVIIISVAVSDLKRSDDIIKKVGVPAAWVFAQPNVARFRERFANPKFDCIGIVGNRRADFRAKEGIAEREIVACENTLT